jgi:hypothetical protein
MLTKLISKFFGELVCSKSDGSLSLSRLAAATAHALAAIFFVYWNLYGEEFNWDLWVIYLGFATGHAIWDKSWMTTKGAKDAKPNND